MTSISTRSFSACTALIIQNLLCSKQLCMLQQAMADAVQAHILTSSTVANVSKCMACRTQAAATACRLMSSVQQDSAVCAAP